MSTKSIGGALLPCEDRFLEIEGFTLRYWEAGTSERGEDTILLLHGLGGSVEQWAYNISDLAKDHRVIAFDWPGNGLSSLSSPDWSLPFIAGVIGRAVVSLGIHRVTLVGLSMGGALSMALALARPDLVDRLVLVAAAALDRHLALSLRLGTLPFAHAITGKPPRWLFSMQARTCVDHPDSLPTGIVDFYYGLVAREQARKAFFDILRANCDLSGMSPEMLCAITNRIPEITAPTLIIHGRNDRLIQPLNAEKGSKKFTFGHLVWFDSCRHNPQFEHADAFNNLVREHMKMDAR